MRTTCPTCETGYTIPDERIGAKGRKVRCTKCGEEWRVFLATEEETVAPPMPRTPAPAKAADPWSAADEDSAAGTAAEEAAFRDEATAPSPDTAGSEITVDAAPDPTTPAQTEPHPDAPPAPPPGRRVRIRTKRRFPRIRKDVVAKIAVRVAPFAGPAVFLAACLVVTGVYVFRQKIVATAPDLAGLYSALGAPVNLRGLVFGRIETLREIDNGQPVLVVEGSIANVSAQMREVPALRFALRGPDTQELYAWSIDPKSTTIESGDTIRFRTRLAAPPDLATEVQVRFVERRSQHAGLP